VTNDILLRLDGFLAYAGMRNSQFQNADEKLYSSNSSAK